MDTTQTARTNATAIARHADGSAALARPTGKVSAAPTTTAVNTGDAGRPSAATTPVDATTTTASALTLATNAAVALATLAAGVDAGTTDAANANNVTIADAFVSAFAARGDTNAADTDANAVFNPTTTASNEVVACVDGFTVDTAFAFTISTIV